MSQDQDFNGDIALTACFASSWTPAMVRRWHADPFGFLRPWGEVPALMGGAPPATPPSTGTGVVTFLMGVNFLDGPHFELSRACGHDRPDQGPAGGGDDRGRALRDPCRLVEPRPSPASCSRPRQPEAPVHRRIDPLEQLNRDTRLLVLDQALWRANPPGMLWPEMDGAFVAPSGGNGGPRTAARRPDSNDGESHAGVQSIGSAVLDSTLGDHFELMAHQTLAANELTWFASKLVE
jgi:hypothetical protein